MELFDLDHLSLTAWEQKRQGFNDSSAATDATDNNRMRYPSTPQDFRSFDSLKELWYDGNMLMPEERSGLYNNCTKVILEMAESYIFSRCIYFNLEMTEKYQNNTDRYIKYYTNTVRQIDIYLQEDQLMHTKQGFPLVPAPSYLPNMYELGHSDVRQIDDRASTKIRRVENEMLVIMQDHQEREQQEVSHNSFHSSFSRIRSEELNDMGYCLSRISPITFDDDAFQMPNNKARDRAPTSTPRKRKNDASDRPTTQTPQHNGNNKSLNANTGSNEPTSRFVPSQPNNNSSSSQGTNSLNTTMVYYEKSNGECQGKCASIQTSPKNTYPQELLTPPRQQIKRLYRLMEPKPHLLHPPRKPTSTGETQISSPKD